MLARPGALLAILNTGLGLVLLLHIVTAARLARP